MTKRELIIENICSSIKSDAIKNIFLNIFNENCDSIQLSAFEVIIWSAACEQLKSYEITDLNVEIEKSDFKYEDNIYKVSLVTKIDYSVYKKLLPFVKNSNENSFILNLEYENEDFIIKGIQKIDI